MRELFDPVRVTLKEVGSGQAHNHQRNIFARANEMPEQLQGAIIAPVQVFQDQEASAAGSAGFGFLAFVLLPRARRNLCTESADGLERTVAKFFRVVEDALEFRVGRKIKTEELAYEGDVN